MFDDKVTLNLLTKLRLKVNNDERDFKIKSINLDKMGEMLGGNPIAPYADIHFESGKLEVPISDYRIAKKGDSIYITILCDREWEHKVIALLK